MRDEVNRRQVSIFRFIEGEGVGSYTPSDYEVYY